MMYDRDEGREEQGYVYADGGEAAQEAQGLHS